MFQKLDKSKLPNLANIDPILMKATEAFDPGHEYSVPYLWGTVGIGYNIDKIKAAMPEGAPVDSWDLVLKPEDRVQVQGLRRHHARRRATCCCPC